MEFSQPATPVSMRVIVSPARMYEYTKRSIAMPGATGILNGCLSAWMAGVIWMPDPVSERFGLQNLYHWLGSARFGAVKEGGSSRTGNGPVIIEIISEFFSQAQGSDRVTPSRKKGVGEWGLSPPTQMRVSHQFPQRIRSRFAWNFRFKCSFRRIPKIELRSQPDM
jgi:hypothetical protein